MRQRGIASERDCVREGLRQRGIASERDRVREGSRQRGIAPERDRVREGSRQRGIASKRDRVREGSRQRGIASERDRIREGSRQRGIASERDRVREGTGRERIRDIASECEGTQLQEYMWEVILLLSFLTLLMTLVHLRNTLVGVGLGILKHSEINYGDQRFLAVEPSTRRLRLLRSFSPVRGSRGGSTSTSLHTSSNISAMK